VHRIACGHARALTKADAAAFLVRENAAVRCVAENADEPLAADPSLPVLASIAVWAMDRRTAATVEDVAADERIAADARHATSVRALAIVPVRERDGGTPAAAIGVYWRRPHRATEQEMSCLRAVADGASIALASASLAEEVERARRIAETRAERLRHVQRISDAALGDLTVDANLDELLHRVRDAFGADTTTMLLLDEREAVLRVRAAVGLDMEVQHEVRVPVGRGFAGRIAAMRQPIVLEEVDYEKVVSRYIRQKSLRSMAGIPLLAEGRLIGVLHVGSTRPRRFGDEDVNLLRLAGERVGVAMERATAHEAERQARAAAQDAERRAAFLGQASAVLASSLDYEGTLRALADLAVPFLADWCSVDVVELDRTVRRVAIAHGDTVKDDIARAAATYPEDPEGRHPRTRVLRTVARAHREVTADGIAGLAGDEAYRHALQDLGYRSAMFVELVARGEVLGAITLATLKSDRCYGAADLALAEELARRASVAIDNARLYHEAQEASRLKDEFLSVVSHELRTPLAAMLGWVRVLRLDNGARARRAIDTIERSGRAQEKLIDDLLDASRMITGRLRLELEPVELKRIVQAALETVRPAAEAKGVSIETSLGAPAGPVLGDADRLQQVAWNLLSNAVKFTPAGGGIVVRTAVADGHLQLVVADTGKGIAAEFLPTSSIDSGRPIRRPHADAAASASAWRSSATSSRRTADGRGRERRRREGRDLHRHPPLAARRATTSARERPRRSRPDRRGRRRSARRAPRSSRSRAMSSSRRRTARRRWNTCVRERDVLHDPARPVHADHERVGVSHRADEGPDLAAIPVVVVSADATAATKARALGVVDYMTKPIDFDRLLSVVERHC
jgi:signal transduction histidine kinase/putative methionine-R-sulfoxide reductase with GAF domain